MTGPLRLRFFLGGQDLEMHEIAALLARTAPGRCEDLRLPWGAHAGAYLPRLTAALAGGETPVLVELLDDLPAELDRSRMIFVDHHGERAGGAVPTSLHQVFDLLGLPQADWTRRMELVAANDRAHVEGLQAAGATAAEIHAIRAADRAAQGVTEEDEAEGRRAVAARRVCGALTEIITHSHTSSVVADLILPAFGGPGYEALLVVMPGKLAAFAGGTAIRRLVQAVPGGYWGGDLPRRGFWGIGEADLAEVLPKVRRLLGDSAAPTA